MKRFFVFLIILQSFIISAHGVELLYAKKTVDMDFEPKRHTFVSKNCTEIEKCFFKNAIELKTYPNQSPGFSLCYQLGGEPFFGVIKGQKDKEPICKKGEYFANHEALLYHYRDNHFKVKK